MKQEEKKYYINNFVKNFDLSVEQIINTYPQDTMFKKLFFKDSLDADDMDDLKNTLLYTEHNKDSRDLISYAREVLFSWIIEDVLFYLLDRDNLEVCRFGSDSNRKFTNGMKILSDPDLLIRNNQNVYLEVISNYPYAESDTYWESVGYFDLRDHKLKNLLFKSQNSKVFIIGINVKRCEFFIKEINKQMEHEQISAQYNEWGKKTNRIYLDDLQFYKLDKISDHFVFI